MTLTIVVAGLELWGRHGALPEERERGQRFLFDVELETGDAGARSDDLADTIDYREVVAAVREVSDGTAFRLLEALAWQVAETLAERFGAVAVRVRVRKPDVDLGVPVEHAAVRIERGVA